MGKRSRSSDLSLSDWIWRFALKKPLLLLWVQEVIMNSFMKKKKKKKSGRGSPSGRTGLWWQPPSGFDSPPMRKLPCLFWTPKRYWVRSSPGKTFSGEVDRCLTGPRGMTREAENLRIIKKKKYLCCKYVWSYFLQKERKLMFFFLKIIWESLDYTDVNIWSSFGFMIFKIGYFILKWKVNYL